MPRFVVLRHEGLAHAGCDPHWDLMLEHGETLICWALPEPPSSSAGSLGAERIADHRPFYLDYEGPISDERGSVTRWDAGTFELIAWGDDRIVAEMQGARLVGRVVLSRTDSQSPHRWRVEFVAA